VEEGFMISLGGQAVGDGEPHYVIAEIGSNHNGDIGFAKELIRNAKEAGAQAAKFQSWSPTTLVSAEEFRRNTSYGDTHRHFGSLEEMVRRYALTAEQHHELSEYCTALGIHFMSSAFAPEEVDLLVACGSVAVKIASMDINNLPLLEHAGGAGLPVILSTGMATLAEIAAAVEVLRSAGCEELALLHCVSVYPAPPSSLNLLNIPMLEQAFDLPIGFSDHSLGPAASIAAAALGSCMTEKHFTTDTALPGWDHHMSATPSEMKTLVEGCEVARLSRGTSTRRVSAQEIEKRRAFRRSLVTRRSLDAGHVVQAEDLIALRPGTGIGPDQTHAVVGRPLTRSVPDQHLLSWSDLGLAE
jgi:N,N'-diacetyllegionaminate synthase